jgi:hypothetical protein
VRRPLLRLLTLPLGAGFVTAVILAAGAGTAFADDSITTGTATLTIPITPADSFTAESLRAGISMQPLVPSSQISFDGTTATVTYLVTGGDAQVSTLTGSVSYSDSLKFSDVKTHKSVTFTGLTLDLAAAQFDGTSSADGSEQVIFDTAGDVSTSSNDNTQTYSASVLEIDTAGAAYLNAKLHTSFFAGGMVVGSFSTTFGS